MNGENEPRYACPVCEEQTGEHAPVVLTHFLNYWECPANNCRSRLETVLDIGDGRIWVGLINPEWARTFNQAVREFMEQSGTANNITPAMVEAGKNAVSAIPRITRLFRLTEIPENQVRRH